ncbi:NUDIX domain-containing protein [Pseudoroseomonas wenyumeiae]
MLARLDRGAIPAFGIQAQGVHLNGLVRRPDGLHIWLGFRSRTKAVAPGQWDNIVAGGMPAGLDAVETLAKEAGEEAGLPPEMVALARPVARLSYNMQQPGGSGLRRDILHVFDLELPEDFTLPRMTMRWSISSSGPPGRRWSWCATPIRSSST